MRKKTWTESDRNASQFMEQTNHDLNSEELNNDESDTDTVDPDYAVGVSKSKYKTRVKNKRFEPLKDPGSSPSLPSSDSSDDDNADDPTISRIRQKAAELKEKINKEKLAVRKQPKFNKPVKMEVETVSEGLVSNIGVEETLKQTNSIERSSELKSPILSKTVFKIPKKSTNENGVVSFSCFASCFNNFA